LERQKSAIETALVELRRTYTTFYLRTRDGSSEDGDGGERA
jgi:hypothetical protein